MWAGPTTEGPDSLVYVYAAYGGQAFHHNHITGLLSVTCASHNKYIISYTYNHVHKRTLGTYWHTLYMHGWSQSSGHTSITCVVCEYRGRNVIITIQTKDTTDSNQAWNIGRQLTSYLQTQARSLWKPQQLCERLCSSYSSKFSHTHDMWINTCVTLYN